MSRALGMLGAAVRASPGGALMPDVASMLALGLGAGAAGTVYVCTCVRAERSSGSSGASANGSSMVGISTMSGAVVVRSAEAVRSAGAGGGGGARRVGVGGAEKDKDVLLGRLPAADEPMLGADEAGAVRLTEAGLLAPGTARKGRARGAQTLGRRWKEDAWAELIERGMEGAKQEGAPNAPWMVWMRWEETAMVLELRMRD